MIIRFVALMLLLAPVIGMAASAPKMALDPVEISLKDKVSLQRGAQLFVNYCLSCHSVQYMRYNRMAADLDIPEDVVRKNMLLSNQKIGDLMTTTMSQKDAVDWFGGVAPPDLSLTGRLRGADWLYNYLRTFYLDETTASGWNNVVFENVAMPHALYELQGLQRAVFKTVTDEQGIESKVFDTFEMVRPGTMTPQEYDEAMRDLTNFMVYVAEPAKMVRVKYGVWVMLFLAVFGGLAYALKKEYWRDIH